jgi:hypothetical protein
VTYVVGSQATAAPLVTAGASARPVAAAGTSNTQFCFQVTLRSGAPPTLQGASLTAVWQFAATSSS